MKYKALALDLDGTLTNREKKVPVGNKEAIEKAIDAGVKVILASGRPLFGITPIARELELDKKGGYILAYNGGCIVDCKTGKQMSATIMPQDCIADICSLARANGVYALTYADTQIAAESDSDEYVKKEAICNSTTIKKVDDLRKFVDYPVEKFLVVGEHEKLIPVQKALLDKHEGVINAFFSENYFLVGRRSGAGGQGQRSRKYKSKFFHGDSPFWFDLRVVYHGVVSYLLHRRAILAVFTNFFVKLCAE